MINFLGCRRGFDVGVGVVHFQGQRLFYGWRLWYSFCCAVSMGAVWCMDGIGLSSWDVDGSVCWGEGG